MSLSAAPAQDKAALRAWARGVRAGLPDASEPLCELLAGLLRDRGARTVLAYRHLEGEPDVSALASEFRLLTTRARFRPTPRLTVHGWETASEPSRFGALQPPANAPEVSLAEVDAVVLPALAFDRAGVRLGYGGGFYDRLLPGFAGPVVGVVWDALLLPAGALPRESHDRPAGWVVTEAGVWRAAER